MHQLLLPNRRDRHRQCLLWLSKQQSVVVSTLLWSQGCIPHQWRKGPPFTFFHSYLIPHPKGKRPIIYLFPFLTNGEMVRYISLTGSILQNIMKLFHRIANASLNKRPRISRRAGSEESIVTASVITPEKLIHGFQFQRNFSIIYFYHISSQYKFQIF